MQNPYFQAALGLLPVVLLFLCLFLLKKSARARNLFVAIVFFFAGVALVVLGILRGGSDIVAELPEDARLSYIYAVADNGNAQLAELLLKEERRNSVYDVSQTLCSARLKALQGEYSAAKILYEKVTAADPKLVPSRELDTVAAGAQDEWTDSVLQVHFLGNPEAASESDELQKDARDAAKGAVKQTGQEDEATARAAKLTAFAHEAYEEYLQSGQTDLEDVKKQLRRMETLEKENPSFFDIPGMRIARLKLQILCEDYRGIAACVDNRADYNELLIVTELYLNGYIKPSYFSQEYTGTFGEQCSALAGHLQTLYDRYTADAPKAARRAARQQIKGLQYSAKNPALYLAAQSLTEYTQEPDAYDSTKVHLQMAKISRSVGDDVKADEHLDASLNTVGDCADGDFARPMYEIIGIITEEDDPENLKNVADYVDRVLENSTTIKMSAEHMAPAAHEDGTPDEDAASAEGFAPYMVDHASKKRASINITRVDASQFDTVEATINVDDGVSYSAEQLKGLLAVQDCGVDITDFTVEKVEYTKANILMCCDISGSMAGSPLEDLKTAVSGFIENRSDIESIALVTFNDGVQDVYSFGSSDASLSQVVAELRSGGGTNMYGAVTESIGKFQIRPGEINYIILLSDGADNSRRTTDDIEASIGQPCRDKGIILHSIGLGFNVDADYLNSFASFTGGEYLHVNDSVSLASFYDFLHNQILNQYRITFRAQDTLSTSRLLKVAVNSDILTYDIFRYTLDGGDDLADPSQEGEVVYMQKKSVYGLDTRLLYKSSSSQTVHLKGDGFEKQDMFSVDLKGNIHYTGIAVKYVDGSTLALTIPAGIACGSYDLHVSINGKKAILDKELTVATQGSEVTTSFGPYVFTSFHKEKIPGGVMLSGYVTMNGWLRFGGDISLEGDLRTGEEILLTDIRGTYVQYYPGSSEGMAAHLAEKNQVLPVQAMGRIRLFNDQLHKPVSDEYRVEPAMLPECTITSNLHASAAGLSLYPDRMVIAADEFNTEFPFQDTILKVTGNQPLFSFDADFTCLLTARNIGIDLDTSIKAGKPQKKESATKTESTTPGNFGNIPMLVDKAEFVVKLNTIKEDYSVEFDIGFDFLKLKGLGLMLKWGKGFSLSEVEATADFHFNGQIGAIPVTYSDFTIAVKEIDPDKKPWYWMIEGGFDLDAWKVGKLLPKLDKWLGDVSLLKLDDSRISVRFGEWYLGLRTELKFLGEIKVAGAEVKAGHFPYSNVMVNMDNEEVKGFSAKFTSGIEWESGNCEVILTGSNEWTFSNRYNGFTTEGHCKLALEWWVFTNTFEKRGRAMIGFYEDHSGNAVFCVKAMSLDNPGDGNILTIIWSRNTGMECGSSKV